MSAAKTECERQIKALLVSKNPTRRMGYPFYAEHKGNESGNLTLKSYIFRKEFCLRRGAAGEGRDWRFGRGVLRWGLRPAAKKVGAASQKPKPCLYSGGHNGHH